MKINISGKQEYTPKWNGNRKAPEKDRIRVEYRYLTCEEEERFSNFSPRYDTEGKDVELEIKTHANEIWELCVTKISGLTDEADKPIDPKGVLKAPGVYELITEVVAQVKKGISEDDSKN